MAVASEEQTLFRGPSSLSVSAGKFALGVLLAIGGGVLAYFYSPWFLILTGIAVLGFLLEWLRIRFTIYEVTTERIRVTTGILTRRTEEMELYRVQDYTLIEPFLDRVFGAGTIRMSTMDPSSPTLHLVSVPGARSLREQLRQCIETCRERKRVRVAELE